jgi:hypothetical protein
MKLIPHSITQVNCGNLLATEDGRKLSNAKSLNTVKYIYALKATSYYQLNIEQTNMLHKEHKVR